MNNRDYCAQATGEMNPHYKPPIMRWNQVELVAPEGFEFGVIYDNDGLLSIACHRTGEPWPADTPRDFSVIATGEKSFLVTNNERGPAVGHDFEPDPMAPEKCLRCADPRIVVHATVTG